MANKAKHGIDFVEAQQLWKDSNRVEVEANSDIEPRFMVIGKIKDKHWSAIITYRSDNIRIICVRRSRNEEIDLYDQS
ncbi:MAG: BrnT family toxin [Oscillatoriales cyanobacterium SM2_2_1]|nr:BrnT family toxin [Oscillatoriales cyanobacterium SM2_2_1]